MRSNIINRTNRNELGNYQGRNVVIGCDVLRTQAIARPISLWHALWAMADDFAALFKRSTTSTVASAAGTTGRVSPGSFDMRKGRHPVHRMSKASDRGN